MTAKCKHLLIGMMIAVSFSSCYTTKVSVGDLSPRQPMTKINSEWNHHILWGLVPLGNAKMRADDYVGDRTRYMIKTNQSFLNGLVSFLTLSLYTPTTTTYYAPNDDYDYDNRNQRSSQNRNAYERPRASEPVRGSEQDRYLVEEPAPKVARQQEPRNTEPAPVQKAMPKTQSEVVAPVQKTYTQSEPAAPAPAPREVKQSQADSYKATVFFKNGARMDGTVTHFAGDDSKVELKLPSGLVIETKVSEIEKIVKK